MKLNKLFLLLLALPLAFAACEPNKPNKPIETPMEPEPAVLTLTSEKSLQYTPEGGNGVITYTLENAVAGTELTATSTAEWITDITVGETITFVVAANESTQKRNDRIYVSYGDQNFNVFIKQEGVEPVVTFEAQNFEGVYYGTEYSPNYNMAIYLSDLGFTEQGYVMAGATYYTLDLFMDNEPAIDADGYMSVPVGTYSYDGTDSYEDMSIGVSYSSYFKINSDASAYEAQESYDSAELVVTENSVTLVAYIAGVKHIVTYNGSTKFFVGVPAVLEDTDVVTPILTVDYYANMYTATYNYNLYLMDKGSDDSGYLLGDGYVFSLDLYGLEPAMDAEGYMTIPAGTYTYDVNDDFHAFEVGREYSFGCKVSSDATYYEWYEAFEDVTVTVTENSIYMEAMIDGAKFTATYEGDPKFYVGTEASAVAKKSSVKLEKKSLVVF